MSTQEFTVDDLKRILCAGAGEAAAITSVEDIDDVEFEELGYDSLALLETYGRIEREYGITLDEDDATGAKTPRALIAVITEELARIGV